MVGAMNSFRYPILALGLAAAPFAAHAQDASWNQPYGARSSENSGWNNPHRDANGNLEIVNGIMTTGSGSESTLSQLQLGGGAGVQYGQATSTAIGNQLNVITTGNYNTVIVNSEQINNGDVNAASTTTLGGEEQSDD